MKGPCRRQTLQLGMDEAGALQAGSINLHHGSMRAMSIQGPSTFHTQGRWIVGSGTHPIASGGPWNPAF